MNTVNKEYKRLTKKDGYTKELDLKQELGYSYIYTRLSELEDKIEDGMLVELPCKVGDTATAIIDTLFCENSLQEVTIEGIAYIITDDNGDITFQHNSRLFPTKAEAEAKLKELKEGKYESDRD